MRKCGLKCQKGRSTGRNTRSLPLRKCGLKWSSIQILNSVISVTSLAEVWIEIDITIFRVFSSSPSLPLRKCGLKLSSSSMEYASSSSLPLRKCGLKFFKYLQASLFSVVTSLAEVWIEILQSGRFSYCLQSLPLRKCGLKCPAVS